MHINIGQITLTSAFLILKAGASLQAFIHTDNKGGDPGFIPRLFLLVELAVLDLVVEAGGLLAGDRVLELKRGEGSEGRFTFNYVGNLF